MNQIASPNPAAVRAGASDGLGPAESLPEAAVSIRGLRKLYKATGKGESKLALTGIDLDIPRGSLFGLLGPNGAGKSTLINIMAGLVNKTDGTVRLWGNDIDTATRMARASIGIVPQELNIDPFFTPQELLDLQAGLYGVPKAERITAELLQAVGLADKAKAYARTLSGGMRRRLMVAKAMVHRPPILVLDEPTAGVDVELRQSLWAHVRELNAAGTTVLLTTHYLEEAEELCDRIAIINHGALVAHDTTDNLLSRLDNKTLTIRAEAPVATVPEALVRLGMERLGEDLLVLRYAPSQVKLSDVLAALGDAGIGIADLSTEETDLEDIFLQLTRGGA